MTHTALAGAGGALPRRFSAGLDLGMMLGKSATEVRRLLDKLYVELADVQYDLGEPSIAAVGGSARGGGKTLAISATCWLQGAHGARKHHNHVFAWQMGDKEGTDAAFRKADVTIKELISISASILARSRPASALPRSTRSRANSILWGTFQAPHVIRTVASLSRRSQSTRSTSSRRTSAVASATRSAPIRATSARSSRRS